MKKKNEDPGMMTAAGLVAMAKSSHDKIMNEAAKLEIEHRKEIDSLTLEEKRLTVELEAGRELLEKMIADFEAIEAKKTSELLETIKAQSVSEADVKSGRISMAEFIAAGKTASVLEQEVSAKLEEELSQAAGIIRSKGTENKKIELSLRSIQVKIHSMMIAPVKLIQQNLREIDSILSFQFEKLNAEHISAHSTKRQLEDELLNISGSVWRDISIKDGYRLQFNSIFPEELVPDLKEKLSQFEDGDHVSITVYGIGFPAPHGRLVCRREEN